MEAWLTIEASPEADGTPFRQTVAFRVLPKVRPLGWVLEDMVVRHVMRHGMGRTTAAAKGALEGRQRATAA